MKQKYNFLLLSLILIFSFKLKAQRDNHKNQHTENKFKYENCGCSVKIDLKIHNGLYDDYGGQAISESKEVSIGAVTVANLNDTDNDNIVDNIDNHVIASSSGRNEVDLMKLEIVLKGAYVPTCPDLELKLQGNIKLWKQNTKDEIQSSIIPITSLPLTIWVEAIQPSTSLRDIVIQAIVAEDLKDEVKATAIWVDLNPVDVYYTSSSSPEPSTLGLDALGLLQTINNNHLVLPLGMLSKNGDRYGFGTFAEGNMPSKPNIDLYFWGKILFRFKLIPTDAYSLGIINLDIARRKNTKDYVYYSTDFGPTILPTIPPLPLQIEEANDDPQTGGASDHLDEDRVPNSRGYIFSFDAPLTPNGYNMNLTSTSPPIIVRDLNFVEYVRVSFGEDPSGNILAGSRCSINQSWSLNCSNYCSTSNDSNEPYNDIKQSFSQANGGTRIVTRPRVIGTPRADDGNGSINITAMTNNQNTFILQFNLPSNPNMWRLVKLNMSGDPVHVAWSTNITSTLWEINSTDVKIIINQGSIPFNVINDFIFKVLSIPTFVTNQLNNY
ncbi:MAG: hypothetical protein IPJ51_15655 [Saprospiraceae bacterium]|nr:hypothetical protein [Saprospiraceae bacterium]